MAAQPENLHRVVLELPSGEMAALLRIAGEVVAVWERTTPTFSAVLDPELSKLEDEDAGCRFELCFEIDPYWGKSIREQLQDAERRTESGDLGESITTAELRERIRGD